MTTVTMPTPDIVFDTLWGYQRTAALKSGIDLEIFTAIDDGASTAAAIAKRSAASERGIRILCDYLTIIGLLVKSDETYRLTPESAAFLSKKSPMYMGTTAQFLTLPDLKQNFDHLTDTIRRGAVAPETDTVREQNPIWIEFARAMVPMAMPGALAIAELLSAPGALPAQSQILDIAAGHGMFGISIAQRQSGARVAAVDWAPVLSVALEHAKQAGVTDRYRTIPGDAFKVEFGSGYDVALITNFLHHFDVPTNTAFLTKVNRALKPGGKVIIAEFVPNDDRVTPPMAAGFSLTMLAGTPGGDAYTLRQLQRMLADAGFGAASVHTLPTPQTILVAQK